MPALTLFASPGACSLVSLILLEYLDVPYQLSPVILPKGQHKTPEFLAINPKGKIPALRVDDVTLTETPAIIQYLASRFVDGHLLPAVASPLALAQQFADLSYCAGGIHPLIARYCKPDFFSTDSRHIDGIKAKATEALTPVLDLVEAQLAANTYWYGEQWSAMDAYLFWCQRRLRSGGFDFTGWPAWQRHYQTQLSLPQVERALSKEEALGA